MACLLANHNKCHRVNRGTNKAVVPKVPVEVMEEGMAKVMVEEMVIIMEIAMAILLAPDRWDYKAVEGLS